MNSSLSSSSFNNRLAHAQSTPAGVDGSRISSSKTPPTTPKNNGKILSVRVQMLDDSITIFQVQAKAVGRLLFDQVCKQLNLLEADYFGLEYQDVTTKFWLDFEKPISRQIGLSLVDPFLKFIVKFYTPDPAHLEEEYTRYLFCLQIKRDLMQGDLQCNDNTAALIISYVVQAECGDYSPEDYPDHTYLSSLKFVSYQDRELEMKIMVNHKKHAGQSPAEADLNLLETARRCELYGMKMHPARDQEGVPLNLAVAHMGIVVFQNSTKINTFSWAKIRKISFKRKKFLIKLHPEGYGYHKDIVEFTFDNRNQCKSFWKKCVENHGFFRCSYVKCIPRQKARVLSRGSSFRYSGKTQKQMVEYVRENYIKRQTFQRSQSFRHQSSIHSSVVNVGASISAHPLLPLGENAIAGSGASLSCGSMTLSGSLCPITLQDGGLQTAPTVMNQQQQVQPQQPSQLHQIAADLHEPTAMFSDITSIASQSPPCDTGQIRQYPHTTRVHKHQPGKLRTNTMLLTTVKNQTNNLDLELPSVAHRLDTDSERMRFNYDIGKLNTEFRFPSSVKKKASTAATLFNRLKINDPDILRDLGEPTRVEDSSWLRSASCKELSARQIQQHLSNEGSSHKRVNHGRSFPNKFDRNCYSSHGQAHVLERGAGNQSPPEIKFYSNSYPGMGGTSDKSKGNANTGTSAGTSPGAAIYLNEHMIENNIENYYEDKNDEDVDDGDKDGHWKVSAEDLSHDSYEILERESAFRSKSSSVNSDEMFIMENDYKSISKHILWKEESMDVEKRLGYVEPKYRDIDFNQFNEICKRGFALRNRNASQSHGNIKFSEYAVKSGDSSIWKEDRMEKKRIFHDAVGRTKSDPYMCSEHKALNKQKLFGLHQKSFDLAAPDADNLSFVLSKSSVDIPYTLRIRNEMNGTARDQDSLAGFDDSDTAEPSRCKSEGAGSVFVAESKIKSQASMYASYDSGLSLSLGNDNVDDNEINLKNVLFTKNYEQVVTTKKSTKLMLSLSEENNENVDATEQPVPVSTKQPSVRAKNVKNAKIKSVEEHDKGKQHIIKVKSVEAPKKNHSTKIRKSKSAESYIRKNSFLYADSASFRGKKEIIVIDSDEYHSFDDSRSDKRSDGSDSVIIVEYRGNKRKKLSKKTSSDSRGSQAESEASSFDAPRIKKKDLKKRNTSTYFYNKERIPTIEISEDEIYKVEYNNGNLGVCHTNEYEYSSDERQASGSDLSKTDFGNEIVTDELASPDKKISGDIIPSDAVLVVSDEMSPTSALKVDNVEQPLFSSNVACTIKVNQDFTSSIFGVKNCQILTKLGFSEGSAIVHSRPTLSPTIARRAKSLDTPIISLHRLPPVTSFSSKDDTVDNEEGVILEEKALSKKKYKNSSSEDQPLQVELQKAREPYVEKPEVKIKPNLKVLTNRLKSNSIPVPSLRKKSYDASTPDFNGRNWPETETLNKERSKSEGYEDNLLKNITLNTPDKKHSSRQERLDSFKKLKNFSIELWESDDVEQNRKKTLLNSEDDKDYDNVFVDAMENINRKKEKKDLVDINKEKPTDLLQLNDTKLPAEEVPQFSLPKPEAQISVEVTEAIPKSNYSEQQEYLPCLPNMTSVPDFLPVSEKRNFDEELSTSSSIPAEVINHVPFDNSGSSSEEEAILPPDYPEKEMPDLQPMHITLDMSIATIAVGVKPPPATLSAPFNSGFFSLSRTLSRISERSTTSEQEHTDFDDDSTKPLSRSVSIDDSILSSDQHYSISSDPPSGMNLENVFDDDDFPVDSELDQIPSSLLLGDKKWPSPSHSLSSIKTPIINSEMYSAVPDVVTLSEGSINMFQLENDDGKEEEVSVSEDRTLQEDNEYLLEHDQNEKFHRTERTQGSIGDDTSACITTSDWSSSTGTTIKNAQTRTQCVSKSEDNSLTCEYGASLSNDIISESRKSIDELDSLFCEKKYLSLDSKQTSVERKIIFLPPIFHSFDDEYDSPYTESEDSPSNSMSLFRKQLPAPPEAQPLGEKLKLQDQPPTPPIHCQNNASSCVQRLRTRVERNRAVKFLPQYTSSSMSTSLESPTNAERKLAKAIAKAKCYSYYSLARSPPSDGSSSSGDLPDTPLIPNTIPRVSKRRRNLNPSRRPQLREQCKFNCSRSSTCRQPFYHPSRRPKY